ncbi:glycine betaine ABC transporter substrate-binding protein [Nocardioides sambongensis]|uniref:glycine betaine ABC transporter substrate-binding protein n=1 Tax=Nocardioides sambongensis TaxID=2589074 RepID=UPI00112C0134|nr:glycine betaine ABC transporter substrate-binding protein [Nocardioides sambongensis]
MRCPRSPGGRGAARRDPGQRRLRTADRGRCGPEATLAASSSEAGSLDGAEIAVGSKNFSENIILGKIALIMLKAAGAEVTDLTNIPGSTAARQAEVEGQIDAMWEYTGTGWINYLGHDKPIPDEQEQYQEVRDEDLEKNDLVWLPPAPMNNTYGFAITRESVDKYGIKTLSDIKKLPKAEQTYCVETEFTNRPDGLPGMLKTYGLSASDDQLKIFQTGAIYDATDRGECVLGEVFTTDGRILALDLTVLEDDKEYFPKYNVSLVLREELYEEYPQIEDLMAPVTEKLTDEELIAMNAQVDVDGKEPTDVAYDWLEEQGFID